MCPRLLKLSTRSLLGLLTLACIGILGMAYILEHFYDVHPCQMCLYEQDVFMFAGGLAFISFVVLPARWQRHALSLLGLVFLGGAFLAAYHVAIQQHWVALPTFCSAQDFTAFDSIEALKEQMLKTPFVRCDQVSWSFLGLSLAGYNLLVSLFLALLCWQGACKRK
jgi:disulfide bond formation protein DsbB